MLVVILLSMVCSSCNELNTNYTKYTTINGILHYTFEYPVYYKDISLVPYSYWSASVLSSSARIKSGDDQPPDSYLSIEVYDANRENNLSEYIDDCIQQYSSELVNGESKFKLIDRNPVIVGGIEGEIIEYSNVAIIRWSNEEIQQIHREAYLKYAGNLIKVSIFCTKDVSAYTKSDLFHILETFKILERESCNNSCTSEDVIVRERKVQFRYPCCYEDSLSYYKHIYNQTPDTPEVLLTRYSSSVGWSSWIMVKILNQEQLHLTGNESDELRVLQENVELDTAQFTNVENEYSIIEQSWTTTDDRPSINIISKYIYNKFQYGHVWPILENTPLVVRSVYFYSKGYVFKIAVVSSEDEIDHDKLYFDEIISSVRFID